MTQVTTGDGLASNMAACCDILALFCIYSPSLVSYSFYTSHITLLQLDCYLLYVYGPIWTI